MTVSGRSQKRQMMIGGARIFCRFICIIITYKIKHEIHSLWGKKVLKGENFLNWHNQNRQVTTENRKTIKLCS